MSAVSKTKASDANGWTVEQAMQALEGRNAQRRGEPFTHANGPHWTAGWVLGGVGINPITAARVSIRERS